MLWFGVHSNVKDCFFFNRCYFLCYQNFEKVLHAAREFHTFCIHAFLNHCTFPKDKVWERQKSTHARMIRTELSHLPDKNVHLCPVLFSSAVPKPQDKQNTFPACSTKTWPAHSTAKSSTPPIEVWMSDREKEMSWAFRSYWTACIAFFIILNYNLHKKKWIWPNRSQLAGIKRLQST